VKVLKQTEQVNMRLSPQLVKRWKQEAKKLKVSQTEFVRKLLVRYFQEQDLKRSLETRSGH
jgi:hypothetical protein